MQHTLETVDTVVDRLEILDAVWLAADIGMDRERLIFARCLPSA
jgi:hypothetical protein